MRQLSRSSHITQNGNRKKEIGPKQLQLAQGDRTIAASLRPTSTSSRSPQSYFATTIFASSKKIPSSKVKFWFMFSRNLTRSIFSTSPKGHNCSSRHQKMHAFRAIGATTLIRIAKTRGVFQVNLRNVSSKALRAQLPAQPVLLAHVPHKAF